MISPTKLGIRSDAAGDGTFDAPRGGRRHGGLDFLCMPGQELYLPIDSGVLKWLRYPYADNLKWKGIQIVGRDNDAAIELVIFYCVCELAGNRVFKRGEVIGYCQDITLRYPGQEMHPHVHLQIERIDPMRLMTQGNLYDWSKWSPEQWAKG
jgi:hypothetical protein